MKNFVTKNCKKLLFAVVVVLTFSGANAQIIDQEILFSDYGVSSITENAVVYVHVKLNHSETPTDTLFNNILTLSQNQMSAFSQGNAMIRFNNEVAGSGANGRNPGSIIDVRDGNDYKIIGKDSIVHFAPEEEYHIWIDVQFEEQTYSVWVQGVTSEPQTPLIIAKSVGFRLSVIPNELLYLSSVRNPSIASNKADILEWKITDAIAIPDDPFANVAETPSSSICVYSGPNDNSIRIAGTDDIHTLELFDVLGHKVLSANSPIPESIDISQLAPATYIVKLYTVAHKTLHQLIIKK